MIFSYFSYGMTRLEQLPTLRTIQPNDSPELLKSAEVIRKDMERELSHLGSRYQGIKRSPINQHNYAYPSPGLQIAHDLPIRITTPFKYYTQAPVFLDSTVKDHIVIVLQQEGGEGWLGEIPCREFLIVLKFDSTKKIYEEFAAFPLGSEMNLEKSDWYKTSSMQITGNNQIIIHSDHWYGASTIRFSSSSLFSIQKNKILCLKKNTDIVRATT